MTELPGQAGNASPPSHARPPGIELHRDTMKGEVAYAVPTRARLPEAAEQEPVRF